MLEWRSTVHESLQVPIVILLVKGGDDRLTYGISHTLAPATRSRVIPFQRFPSVLEYVSPFAGN